MNTNMTARESLFLELQKIIRSNIKVSDPPLAFWESLKMLIPHGLISEVSLNALSTFKLHPPCPFTPIFLTISLCFPWVPADSQASRIPTSIPSCLSRYSPFPPKTIFVLKGILMATVLKMYIFISSQEKTLFIAWWGSDRLIKVQYSAVYPVGSK